MCYTDDDGVKYDCQICTCPTSGKKHLPIVASTGGVFCGNCGTRLSS